MTFGESCDYFQRVFGPGQGRFKGDMRYMGGKSFRIDGLKITGVSPEFDALVTFEDHQTVIVNLGTNRVFAIPKEGLP